MNIDSLDDVVASFSYGGADSSVTAIKSGVDATTKVTIMSVVRN